MSRVRLRSRMRIARTTLASVLALSLLAAPLAAEAQSAEKVYRIGYLSIGSGTGAVYTRPLEGFRQRLRELGWVEGRNIAIEFRYAEGRADRLPGLADELVRLKVDIITAVPTPAALAARNATNTIPIVGMSLTEPVAVGLVASLAHVRRRPSGLSSCSGTSLPRCAVWPSSRARPGSPPIRKCWTPPGPRPGR